MLLKNKTALITGAAAGIGEATAEYFAEQGARVVLLDCNAAAVAAVAERVAGRGYEAMGVTADVQSSEQVEDAFARARARFGGIDLLVNNAGMYPRRRFVEMTEAEWDTMIDVNLKGTYPCSKAAVPGMIERGGGKIVNTSSVTFFLGMAPLTHYVAAKGGIVGFTRSLARELGPQNIYVNCITPGAIQTESEKTVVTEEQANAVIELQSIKRRLLPVDVARVSAFLCSPLSDGITGQTINVDGGWVMY